MRYKLKWTTCNIFETHTNKNSKCSNVAEW